MVSYRMIAIAGFLASVNALPLNINLGAYSPALYVLICADIQLFQDI